MTAVVPPLDALRYISKADPLERRVTFDDLQTRPLGFQSAMPRDPIASMTNSFEFKVREGEMFEANKAAVSTMTAEKLQEATAQHVASTEEVPLELASRLVAPPRADAALMAHAAPGGTGEGHAAQFAAQEAEARLAEALQLHRDHAAAQSSVSLHTPAVPHTPILQALDGVDGAGQFLPAPAMSMENPAADTRQWARAMQTWMSEQAQRGMAPIPGVQAAQDLGRALSPRALASRIGASAPSLHMPNPNLQGWLSAMDNMPTQAALATAAGTIATNLAGVGSSTSPYQGTVMALDALVYGGLGAGLMAGGQAGARRLASAVSAARAQQLDTPQPSVSSQPSTADLIQYAASEGASAAASGVSRMRDSVNRVMADRAERRRQIQSEALGMGPGQAPPLGMGVPLWAVAASEDSGPNRYMHEGFKEPNWRQGIVDSWNRVGQPSEMQDKHIQRMMGQAIRAGQGQQAIRVHERVPDHLKNERVGDMLDGYKRRVMPPIHTAEHERPVDDRSAKKAYDQLVAKGYPKQDANDYVRNLRAKYGRAIDENEARRRQPAPPPMPEVPSEFVPAAPTIPPVPEEFAGDEAFVARRRAPAAPPMPALPPGY